MSTTCIERFLKNEDGAVTVDWVVLTAAVLGMAIMVVALIQGGATDVSTGIGAKLSSATLYTIEF